MRRLFFVVLFLNLLLLAWNLYEAKQQSREIEAVAIDFGNIRLLAQGESLQQEPDINEVSESDVTESDTTNETIASSDGQDSLYEKRDEQLSIDSPQEKQENTVSEDVQEGIEPAGEMETISTLIGEQAKADEYTAVTGTAGENEHKTEVFSECGSIGHIELLDAAERLQERLTGQGIDVNLRTTTDRQRAGFWVIIAPYKDRASALQAEKALKEKGVSDIWRFLKGEFKNGISLGMYSRRKNAEIRKRSLEEKGFYPEVMPRFREIKRYWIDYELTGANDKSNLQAILVDFQDTDVATKDCLIPQAEESSDLER